MTSQFETVIKKLMQIDCIAIINFVKLANKFAKKTCKQKTAVSYGNYCASFCLTNELSFDLNSKTKL